MRDGHIPEATVTRLPVYLHALMETAESGVATLSSDALARATGLNSAKVRKDLSFLGTYGTRGVGYRVAELTAEISQVLGVTDDRPIVIVGIGNLGRALASYDGFSKRGFRIAALVDANPALVGTKVGDHVVELADQLTRIVSERKISVAVVAVPARHAQKVVDDVVETGVTAVLNFAPTHVEVPATVSVRTVDLSTELQILSFYQHLHTQVPSSTV